MAVGEIRYLATLDTSNYKRGAKEVESANRDIESSTDDSANKSSKSFGKMGDAATAAGKTVAVAFAAAAVAAGALVASAIKSTAALEQNIGGSEVVFGEYAANLQEIANKSFSNMGTSVNQFLETANKMGSLFQGAGFSVQDSMKLTTQAMQRATDVATAMGISTDMALESIAGAAKGNFTMMDNLGVKDDSGFN